MVERIKISPEQMLVKDANGQITFDSNHTAYVKAGAGGNAHIHAMGPGTVLANRQIITAPNQFVARYGAGWVNGSVAWMGDSLGRLWHMYSPPWDSTCYMLPPTRVFGTGVTPVFSRTWNTYNFNLYKADGSYIIGPLYSQITGYGPSGAAWGTTPTGYVCTTYGTGFSGFSMVPGDQFRLFGTKVVVKFTELPSWITGMEVISSWRVGMVATILDRTLPLMIT